MMNRVLVGIAVAGLLTGCVAGPEEIAAENKKSETKETVVAQGPESSPQQEVVQASSEETGDRPEFKKTASGLKYRLLREGSGAQPKATSTVTVNYRGWLDNGNEFDSSYKRGKPISFPLNGVIPGWTEGLQLVKEGGKIELEIPSELGYGRRGAPPTIPPNSTLHFEVELISID